MATGISVDCCTNLRAGIATHRLFEQILESRSTNRTLVRFADDYGLIADARRFHRGLLANAGTLHIRGTEPRFHGSAHRI